MVAVRLFASARESAGTAADDLPGATVGDVIAAAVERYGSAFEAELTQCRIWCNGEPVDRSDPVAASDEIAFLPPVSGGC